MSFDLLILSDIRFVREGLADALARDDAFQIAGVAPDIEQACVLVSRSPPRIILVDTALPQGIGAVGKLRTCAPEAKIVAFALTETEFEVISWARAGIYGYIPRNTSLTDLVGLLNNVIRGEQICPTRIASGLLRWIARHAGDLAQPDSTGSQSQLTTREQEVARLIDVGLSNKEIARRLGLSLATVKSHVHNILAKLKVRKRALAAQRLRGQRIRRPHTPLQTGTYSVGLYGTGAPEAD
jgi:two-component system nitrate/nitrite response regulator NarL